MKTVRIIRARSVGAASSDLSCQQAKIVLRIPTLSTILPMGIRQSTQSKQAERLVKPRADQWCAPSSRSG